MAILRSADASALPAVARALAAGGVTCLEVTLTTAGALDALAGIRANSAPTSRSAPAP